MGWFFKIWPNLSQNWLKFKKILEKIGNFVQNLAPNWTDWYMNGLLFLEKLVFVWVYFQIPWWHIPTKTKLQYPRDTNANYYYYSYTMIYSKDNICSAYFSSPSARLLILSWSFSNKPYTLNSSQAMDNQRGFWDESLPSNDAICSLSRRLLYLPSVSRTIAWELIEKQYFRNKTTINLKRLIRFLEKCMKKLCFKLKIGLTYELLYTQFIIIPDAAHQSKRIWGIPLFK